MDKEWIKRLAEEIERKHGKEKRACICGDIDNISDDSDAQRKWFHCFTHEIDKLEDKQFLQQTMARHCPCPYPEAEKDIRHLYETAQNLEEFVYLLDKNGIFVDRVRLDGNVLYATKLPFSLIDIHNDVADRRKHTGRYTEYCHCDLGSRTDEPISDIFCHCCTVGYYGKMFKNALGIDVKVEFVESVITGGRECTAAIHLPEIISIAYLSDYPQYVSTVSRWLYDDLMNGNADESEYKQFHNNFVANSKSELPIRLVAIADNQCVGTVTFIGNDFPGKSYTPWLGGLYVEVSHRNRGIGQRLIEFVKRLAKKMGYDELYLSTHTAGEYYIRLGWEYVETCANEDGQLWEIYRYDKY
ncbi:MAG: GNAT family N-acetyltransferase [Oscillospiraceae bacterium]|jgi:GNAT superfamily N-acetyltransferase|nr:GNAT family N-acetyltransferase [Oscillospiraceae bacterium]